MLYLQSCQNRGYAIDTHLETHLLSSALHILVDQYKDWCLPSRIRNGRLVVDRCRHMVKSGRAWSCHSSSLQFVRSAPTAR